MECWIVDILNMLCDLDLWPRPWSGIKWCHLGGQHMCQVWDVP